MARATRFSVSADYSRRRTGYYRAWAEAMGDYAVGADYATRAQMNPRQDDRAVSNEAAPFNQHFRSILRKPMSNVWRTVPSMWMRDINDRAMTSYRNVVAYCQSILADDLDVLLNQAVAPD